MMLVKKDVNIVKSYFKILTSVQQTRANVMRRQIVQILMDLIVALASKDMKETELIALVMVINTLFYSNSE